MTKKNKKMILIGIDGGTFNVIDPLLKKGLLKNIKNFRHKKTLFSTTPPGTGVSWGSFSTGNNPGKTGIYDFTVVEDNSWKIKIVNRKLLNGKPLWRYLTESGLKSCFVNIPLTYPPEEINGVMISGIDAPTTLSNYVYPAKLKQLLKKMNYEIEASGLKEGKDIVEHAIEILKNKIEVARTLLKEEFDFFIVLFRASDVAQHFAWGGKEVELVYEMIDKFIGDVKRNCVDSETKLIVMSDHGHENVTRAFNVNAWLEKEGYLKLNFPASKGLLDRLGLTREKIFGLLKKFKLEFVVKFVPRKLGKRIPTKKVDFEEALINGFVDLKRTRALAKRAVKTSQIFLNSESRGGIVKKSEEEELKTEIIDKLKKYLVQEGLSSDIWAKEDLYGAQAKNAPDITFYFREKGFDTLSYLSKNMKVWDETKEQATHNTEGVILTDMDLDFRNPRIIDLTPTILKYFGVKKWKMDGKSLL